MLKTYAVKSVFNYFKKKTGIGIPGVSGALVPRPVVRG